ncbi:MAG: AMP-binding protein [Rhodobiaceae bacterium]|nr:AMP-binding protein [Rhodobiaceae bacterium]
MIIRRPSEIENDVTATAAGNLTIDQLLLNQVRKGPHRPFVCDPPNKTEITGSVPHQFSFRELNMRVQALAHVLRNIGLRQDDIVAVRLPNTSEAVIAMLAIWRAGMIACLLPLTWRRREWSRALEAVSPKAVITMTRIGEEDAALTASLMAENQFSIRFVAAFGPGSRDGIIALDSLINDAMASGDDIDDGDASVRPHAGDHVATITFMELAEGIVPVPRCHASWIALAMRPAADLALAPGKRLLNPFMLSQLTSLSAGLLPCLLTGAMMILHHPFDLFALGAQFAAHRPTAMLVPAALTGDLADIEGSESLRAILRIVPFGIAPPQRREKAEGVVFDYAAFGEQALLPLVTGSDGHRGLRIGTYHVRDNGNGSPVVAEVRECTAPTAPGTFRTHEMIRFGKAATETANRHYLEIAGSMAPDGDWVETVKPTQTLGHRPRRAGINEIPVVFSKEAGNIYSASGFVPGVGAIGGVAISLDALDRTYGQIDGAESAVVASRDDGIAVGFVPKGTTPLDPEEVRGAIASLAIAEHKLAGWMTTLSAVPRTGTGDIDRASVGDKASRRV